MLADTLSLFPDLPPAPPPPRRHRCPLCRAGFAPVGASQRIADQRAKADRDWAAAWDREIDAHPDDEVKLEAYALTLAAQTAGRIRIAKVWEDMRGKVAVNLDNSYRAAAARRMVGRPPALVGRFDLRGNAGQVRERAR